MSALVFAFPGNEALAHHLIAANGLQRGSFVLRQFPDEETFVRVDSDVKRQDAIIVCSLDHPNGKAVALAFVARTLRDLGARRIWLVAPYLAYLRQDAQFHPGEGVTAVQFATWLSGFLDGVVTVDPHLHRIGRLSEVYAIRTHAVSAAPAISAWIKEHVPAPILIGPDAESRQWVAEIARACGAPFIVLHKRRLGDDAVDVSFPDLPDHAGRVPVLVDDIISTGRTMIAAAEKLLQMGAAPPLCVGVHGIFAYDAYGEMLRSGFARIVTCNTIAHSTNAIDVHPLVASDLDRIF